MSEAKKKLLAVLADTELADVEIERLADICADKIRRLEDEIERLRGANAMERQRLHDDREAMKRDMDRVRRDPLFGASGLYRFDVNKDERIKIYAQGGVLTEVTLERHGIVSVAYRMPPEAP